MASLKLATLFTALKDAGVTSVEIRYDGGGDSGQVEDVEFHGDNIDGGDLSDRFEGDLQDLAYRVLNDHYTYDWYNNDGGYGTVIISFEDDEPTINVDGYVRELTDAFSSVNLVNIDWGE